MSTELKNPVLVCDVGGSHISAAVCMDKDYKLGQVVSELYPNVDTSEAFVDFLHSLGVAASKGQPDVAGAEFAMPGPFDFAKGISLMQHKLPFLYGVNLRGMLAERFGWQPDQVRFVHDAASFLLGEIGAGAAKGIARAVGITLGTGIGSAFSINGSLVKEGPGVAPGGEIWDLPYEGQIVEEFLSTRAIQRYYQRRKGVLADVSVLAAEADTNPDAAAAFAEFGDHLGKALSKLLAEYAPDVVVLGGGIARSSHLFLPAAQKHLEGVRLQLKPSVLKDNAPLVGAAVAWYKSSNHMS